MALSLEVQGFADRTIAAHAGRPGALLGILERVQEHHPHKYLSPEILEYVAAKTDVPLSQLYSVVTFYALFNLEPQGDHTICIDRKSTRLNSSHANISYAVFCLKKNKTKSNLEIQESKPLTFLSHAGTHLYC